MTVKVWEMGVMPQEMAQLNRVPKISVLASLSLFSSFSSLHTELRMGI